MSFRKIGNAETGFLENLECFLIYFIFFATIVTYLLSFGVFGLNLSAIIRPLSNDGCDFTSTFESSIAFSIIMTLLAAVIICMPCIFCTFCCCYVYCKFCTYM